MSVERDKGAFWLILPTLLVLGVLFVGGFAFGVLQSFGYFSVIDGDTSGASLEAYRNAFANDRVRAGVVLTFRVALLSTVLSTLIALILSIMISRTKRFQSLMVGLVQFNIPIPHVVAATAILLTFSSQECSRESPTNWDSLRVQAIFPLSRMTLLVGEFFFRICGKRSHS